MFHHAKAKWASVEENRFKDQVKVNAASHTLARQYTKISAAYRAVKQSDKYL
jgi:hypothetical protein